MHLLVTVVSHAVVSHAAVSTEKLVPLLMPPIGFALVAVGVFLLFGVVTWTYRDVANRHAHKAATSYHDDHEHGSAGSHK